MIFAINFFELDIITHLDTYQSRVPLALSIGMFDGVHLGHRSIINRLKKVARDKNLKSGVLSFTPHPRLVFNPDSDLKFLTISDEKERIMRELELDFFLIQKFDEKFKNLSGEAFVKTILLDKLKVRHLIIGHDHSFGKNRSGNFKLLEDMSSVHNFTVEQMEAINLENQNISSTKIRNAISGGDIRKANEMLGYQYSISGKVVNGKKIGRMIGYPTANIEFDKQKLLPKEGVYIVNAFVDECQYKGMLSIGTNPTFDGKNITAEVHILDFDNDIYGKTISVAFHKYLHEQIKFDDLRQLIAKLDEDKRQTYSFFKG